MKTAILCGTHTVIPTARESLWNKKSSREYLSCNLNFHRVHIAFKCKHPESKLEYRFYQRVFRKHFPNLYFGLPKTDTFRVCDMLQYKIKANKTLTLHQNKAQKAIGLLSKCMNESQLPAGDVCCLSMDLQQLMVCPAAFKLQPLHTCAIYLVAGGYFKTIDIKYLVSGHSYMPCDRDFGGSIHPWFLKKCKKWSVADMFLNTTKLQLTKLSWIRMSDNNPTSILAKENFNELEWSKYSVFKMSYNLQHAKYLETSSIHSIQSHNLIHTYNVELELTDILKVVASTNQLEYQAVLVLVTHITKGISHTDCRAVRCMHSSTAMQQPRTTILQKWTNEKSGWITQ
ncbi:hypothetical protein PR048_032943 [Dryococelus australis]|uniref:Uncharacterized protein n=1 Tax=Dryococelus australis TaxID=614101 RepID=A0ABQ9G3N7_9NEOP|nr:hypothetical protein PR048_032943 [Dryococelus australis]